MNNLDTTLPRPLPSPQSLHDGPGPVVLDWSAGSSASPNDFEPHSAVLPPSNSSDSVGLMLPPELQSGCLIWADDLHGMDNPDVEWREVHCPEALLEKC